MTVIDDERRGVPVAPLTAHVLKAAYWKGARYGLDGEVLDLADSRAVVPTPRLLRSLLMRVKPALMAVGDYDMARDELVRIVAEGNGAVRQRRAWDRRHDVADVVEEAARATMSGL